jgi:hypothetical protein
LTKKVANIYQEAKIQGAPMDKEKAKEKIQEIVDEIDEDEDEDEGKDDSLAY